MVSLDPCFCELFLLYELSYFIVMLRRNVFMLYVLLTLFYFWAIRSYDRQVEINTYLLTYLLLTYLGPFYRFR